MATALEPMAQRLPTEQARPAGQYPQGFFSLSPPSLELAMPQLHDEPLSVSHEIAPSLASPTNTPKEFATAYTSCGDPLTDCSRDPIRNRHGPNVPGFSCQVNYGPVILTALNIVQLQSSNLATATSQKTRGPPVSPRIFRHRVHVRRRRKGAPDSRGLFRGGSIHHERRFRANLILDLTAGPFAEDEWIGKRICKRNNVYRECSSSGQSLCVASWKRSLFSLHLRKCERITLFSRMASEKPLELPTIAFEGWRQHRTVRHPVIFLVSTGHHAAVDRQYGSCDPCALFGREEENSFRYISRLPDPSERVEGIDSRAV